MSKRIAWLLGAGAANGRLPNWRRRQARQERRRREAILRAKRAYAEAAKEVVASTVGMLDIAKKLFGGRR